MYLVSYGSTTGYYEQEFQSYEEAAKFVEDYEDEYNGMGIECLDDGSGWYWSNKERDYVQRG